MPEPPTVSLPGPVVNVSVARVISPQGSPNGQGAIGDSRELLDAERAALRQARKALERAAEKVLRSQDELLRNSEHQLIDLAIEISRKVLMQEIKAGHHDIAPIVTEALKRVPSRKDVVVHLNPEDLGRCQMAQEPEQTDGARNVHFVPDPKVPRAECALETVEGVVDSSIETQLERVGAALKGTE